MLSVGYVCTLYYYYYSGGACGCLVAEAQLSSYDTQSNPPDLIPLLDRLAVGEVHHERSDTSNQAGAQPLKGPHSLEEQLRKHSGVLLRCGQNTNSGS